MRRPTELVAMQAMDDRFQFDVRMTLTARGAQVSKLKVESKHINSFWQSRGS